MAHVTPGARDRARRRSDDLLNRVVGASLAEPASWAEARRVTEAVGDTQALKPQRVESLDSLCGHNAEGVQGRMFSEAGLLFCRWG